MRVHAAGESPSGQIVRQDTRVRGEGPAHGRGALNAVSPDASRTGSERVARSRGEAAPCAGDLGARFEVLSCLGAGSFCTVYKARQRSDGRVVALKSLRPQVRRSDRESVLRFSREAEVLRRLRHENIVSFLDFHADQGGCHLVLEFLEGETLDQFASSRPGPCGDIPWAVEIIGQIALGLEYAHRRGILHRDLKPSNIMLLREAALPDAGRPDPGARVKILDFGLARMIDQTRCWDREGVHGSLRYMAPEQSGLLRAQVDQRADLYSLGVACYELLAGRPPYEGGEPGTLLRQHLIGGAAPVETVNRAVPKTLSQIVARLMARTPAERYPCASSLRRDLEALGASLRNGSPLVELPAQAPGADESLRSEVELIERSSEQRELRRALDEAAGGRGGLVLVAGESGIGKTRLAKDLRDYGPCGEATFLYGKCNQYSYKVPFHPFGEILERLADRYSRWPGERRQAFLRRHRQALAPSAGLLARLTPSVKEIVGAPPEWRQCDPARDAQRFLEAVCDFFCRTAAMDHPLVLVLDDLQWAQEETLRTVACLAERIASLPLLVVGLYREEDARENSALIQALERLEQEGVQVKSLRPAPLSPEGVRRLVRETLGLSGNGYRPVYQEAYRISRGNPFLARETVLTLLDNRVLHKDPGSDAWVFDAGRLQGTEVPANLLELLSKRFERLETTTRTVLSSACVLGLRFNFDLLLSVTGEDEHRVLDALDEMVRLHFVEEVREGPNTFYRFQHDKVRQALYERIPGDERRGIHQRIARCLDQGRDGPGNAAERVFRLAYHYLNGQDEGKALEYAVAAGDLACRRTGYREAVYYYDQALERLAPDEGKRRSRLQEKMADLYAALGEYDRALDAYGKVDLSGAPPLAHARLSRKRGEALYRKGDVAQALAHLNQVHEILGARRFRNQASAFVHILLQFLLLPLCAWPFHLLLGGRRRRMRREAFKERARAYGMLFYLHFYGDTSRMPETHLMHLLCARKAGDPLILAAAYRDQAMFLAFLRRFRRAARCLRRSARISEAFGDRENLAIVRSYLGSGCFFQGRLEEGAARIQEALGDLRRTESNWMLQIAYVHLITLCCMGGDFGAALRHTQEMGRRVGPDPGDASGKIRKSFFSSLVHALMGNTAESRAHLEETWRILEGAPRPFFSASAHYVAGLNALTGRDRQTALAQFEQAVHLIRKHRLYSAYTVFPFTALIACTLADADSTADPGERQRLQRRARQLLRNSKILTWGYPVFDAQRWVLKGIYLGQRGSMRRARRLFEKGVSTLERGNARFFLAQAHEQIHGFLAGRGTPDEVARHRNRAREIYRDLGLPGEEVATGAETRPEERVGKAPVAGESPSEARPPAPLASRDLDSLLEASRFMASCLDPERVLERILDLSISTLGAERGFLMLEDGGQEAGAKDGEPGRGDGPAGMRIAAARNLEKRDLAEAEFAFSRSVLGAARRTGQPVLVTDAQEDARFQGAQSVSLRNLRSILCVPLVEQERVIGMIYLDNHLVSHLFTEEDLCLASSLGAFAAMALRNARAHEEIRRQRDEIEKLKDNLQENVAYLNEEILAEHNFEEMVGSGPGMQRVFHLIETAAGVRENVLIHGETGTGKELVARAIHRRGARCDTPFVKVNCASIPEGLMESEMFGHEKGAFTGAVERRKGRFELADGGTIFLDEIGEMRPSLQAKLLRVLEDREFERVGGTRTIRVDVRVICATHRCLEKEIANGTFREDLFYRLNVLPIHVPPLRERREDIPPLVAHFVTKLNKRLSKEIRDLDRASMKAVMEYAWPGNVRELEHLVERAAIVTDRPVLNLSPMLSAEGAPPNGAHGLPPAPECAGEADAGGGPDGEALDLQSAVAGFKRGHVQRTLERCGGDRKKAAEMLGVRHTNIYRLIKSLGLEDSANGS